MSPRVGVFVCYCGLNIGTTVDVEAVAAALADYPGVEISTTYKYMCSDPGQQLIRQKVEEHKLDRFIVAACTPNLHLRTYRNLASSLGLNPYQTEQANIREQCSWVHQSDRALSTAKAIDIVKTTVEATRRNEPLTPGEAPITRRTLILGGGAGRDAGGARHRRRRLPGCPCRARSCAGRERQPALGHVHELRRASRGAR